MYTDPLSDFLTRIRNAQASQHEEVVLPSSRMKLAVAKILEQNGFVEGVKETSVDGHKTLTLKLKYLDKQPLIRFIQRISKPGRRVYRGARELPRVLSDQGIAVLSTSAGIMSNKEARKRKLGGEVLCEIY